MVGKCNDVTCPESNVSEAFKTECYNCHDMVHLPCYNIIQSKSKIFISKNIVFICDECQTASPKRKGVDITKTSKLSTSNNETAQSNVDNSQTTSLNHVFTNKRLSEFINTLSTKIDNNTEILSELKDNVNSMHSTIREKSGSSYADIVGANKQQQQHTQLVSMPNTSVASTEEIRELDAVTKLAVKKRQLTAGNSSKIGLGKAVTIETAKPRKSVKETRIRLGKSVYVSRMETSVTVDELIAFIKAQLPDVDEKHFLPRLLVKKGQDLDELTYISFRLQCTDALFSQFMSPDFWPNHVMIGEFFEKQSEKRVKLSDFVADKINELSANGLIDEATTEMNASTSSKNVTAATATEQMITEETS